MAIVIEQQVFRLQITMDDHVSMAIVDARNDLLEKSARFVLLQFAIFHNVIEEFAAAHVLHNHEDVGGRRYHLIQFDDVRMPKQFQILNFSSNFADHIERTDLLSIQNFDGHFVFGQLMFADFHFAKRTRSQCVAQRVVANFHKWLLRRRRCGPAASKASAVTSFRHDSILIEIGAARTESLDSLLCTKIELIGLTRACDNFLPYVTRTQPIGKLNEIAVVRPNRIIPLVLSRRQQQFPCVSVFFCDSLALFSL